MYGKCVHMMYVFLYYVFIYIIDIHDIYIYDVFICSIHIYSFMIVVHAFFVYNLDLGRRVDVYTPQIHVAYDMGLS